jgi:hypothetical protein
VLSTPKAAPNIPTPYDPDRRLAQALELLKPGLEAHLRPSSRKR